MTNCEHELKPLQKPVDLSKRIYQYEAFEGENGEVLILKYCAKCGAVFCGEER